MVSQNKLYLLHFEARCSK